MNKDKALKQWVKQWRLTGKALEQIHREEIQRTDTEQAILNLEDAFKMAIQRPETRHDSGLVEMQYWLNKTRR
jgi:hypothetical protein